MDYLPIFLQLKQRRVLIVGGGAVALRKINLLLDAGAKIDVIVNKASQTLLKMAADGTLNLYREDWSSQVLEGYAIIIAATDNKKVNQAVSRAAQDKNIPVNVVDQTDFCSFIMPSIIDRSPIIAAISTGGTSPVLARLLRTHLEGLIPAGYGQLAKLAKKYRKQVIDRFKKNTDRRRFWEKILTGKISELVFSGRHTEAEKMLKQAIKAGLTNKESDHGDVWLVGAGPGDPDLLTFRALRLMHQADVVLYDRLVSKQVLALVRRDADKIYVGKAASSHSLPQHEINRHMVDLARKGKRVLRLKGGDPFIFARGGEEIEDLLAHGISFQVVPGITAASGCAAYSGIPLTHRRFSQSCVFVTGHRKDGTIDLNWNLLNQPNQTVVIYMGLQGIEIISEQMIAHGVRPDMPAALVQKGTTSDQRVITGTIELLPSLVAASDVKPPTLIIIGEVVTLRKKLNWFEPSQTQA